MSIPTVAVYAIPECYPEGTIAYAHDHAIAIMQEGQVLKYLPLERKTRIKRDNTLPSHLYQLLKESKLLHQDFDLISVDSVQGRSFISTCGKIRVEAGPVKELQKEAEEAWCWFFDKAKTAYILNHELAHIYSNLPFYGSFKDNSLLIHFDGGASKSNFSAWHYKNNKLQNIEYHWHYKYLSSLYNANALSFAIIGAKFSDQHSVAGKFMGFAGLGKYKPNIEQFLIDHNFFHDIWHRPSLFFNAVKTSFGITLRSFDQHHPFIQDVAASIQHYWIKQLVRTVERLQKQTGTQHLYYAGGSALNIVANTQILKSGLFETINIPPCTDDSGLVLGAASYLEQKKGHNIKLQSPYIVNWDLDESVCDINFSSIPEAAKAIVEGSVLGICNGYSECGPRALGNRSIIARSDSPDLARKISCDMKKREWYRPVAPIMLNKNVTYFTGDKVHPLSRFMLIDCDIKEEKQNEIKGAIHVNGSSRIQSITQKSDNPWMYELLTHLDREYNIKALINTSFNRQGEPIVHNHQDAIIAAKNMNIDALILDGKLLLLK